MVELLWLYLCLSLVKRNGAECWSSGGNAEEQLVESSNAFALHLYRYLSVAEGNIFFCPLCISAPLSLLMESSAGRTQAELNSTLRYRANKLDKECVRKSFAQLRTKIQGKPCSATTASALFIQEAEAVEASLAADEALREAYDTEIKMADFAGNPQKAAWDLNEWVKQRTKARVKRLVEWTSPANSILLASAVALRSEFPGRFPGRLAKRDSFRNHGVGDHVINVTMMALAGRPQRVATSYDFRALELPCAGNNVSSLKMWILLPHRVDSLSEVEDGLSTSTFKQLAQSFKEYKVDIALPKVRIEYFSDMTKVLQQMGIKEAFSPEDADFRILGAKTALHLTQVLHKGAIDITEGPSEQPVPTALADSESQPEGRGDLDVPPFIANHPFMFFVMDTDTGMILYMGRLLEF